MLWGHKRPRFGIEVAREIPGVFGYFLVATSVKAELSLDLSETAAIVVAAVRGRQDMVKDYGTLTDQSFCPLILRLDAVMVALDKWKRRQERRLIIPSMSLPGADIILGRRRRQWRPGRGRFSFGNMQKTTKSWIQL